MSSINERSTRVVATFKKTLGFLKEAFNCKSSYRVFLENVYSGVTVDHVYKSNEKFL